MPRPLPIRLALLVVAGCLLPAAFAQHNRLAISPPTAPPPMGTWMVGGDPVPPVSSGLGALQFVAVNYPVPPPQALSRQIESDDERTRQAALMSLGVPSQYLNRGHVPEPHSIDLKFAPLGASDELDALLTVEMDNHLVTAILAPDGQGWKRLATMLLPVPFFSATDIPNSGPSGFLRLERSALNPGRYRAVFRGSASLPNGDFTENEAHLRVLNGHASVTLSFVSASSQCAAPVADSTPTNPATVATRNGCDLLRRWTQPDPADPSHRFFLVTATGHLWSHDQGDLLAPSAVFRATHLHQFACQPFQYNEASQRFEPIAPSGRCPMPSASKTPRHTGE